MFPESGVVFIYDSKHSNQYPDRFNAKIGDGKHAIVGTRLLDVKKSLGNVIDIRVVEPDAYSIEGVLSYMSNSYQEYLQSEWFLQDVVDVKSPDKRRRYDLRTEVNYHLDMIEVDTWRDKIVIDKARDALW